MQFTFRTLRTLAIILLSLVASHASMAETPKVRIITSAQFAILMDYETGEILYQKNADAPMKPASMAKMMTSYLLFRQLAEGSLALNDKMPVSVNAYRRGGSKMFLERGTYVTIEDLLRGIIVQSGNDASIVVAEGLAGTEENFAKEMTMQARELGMMDTLFSNSTGWPDEAMTTTARDLAILSRALISDFPQFYPIYAEKSFEYNGIKQENRNPLLYDMGNIADGLKTGHTEESGYGLAASAELNGQRIIMVLNGLDSKKERRLEGERLMNLALRTFKRYDIVEEGKASGQIPVNLGVAGYVDLVPLQNYTRVLARESRASMTVDTKWPASIDAPVEKGQEIGLITITIDDKSVVIPLIAASAVDKLPWHKQIGAFFSRLIYGNEIIPQE